MNRYALVVVLVLVLLVALTWLVFGGNHDVGPFQPVPTLHACGGALDANGNCGPLPLPSPKAPS